MAADVRTLRFKLLDVSSTGCSYMQTKQPAQSWREQTGSIGKNVKRSLWSWALRRRK